MEQKKTINKEEAKRISETRHLFKFDEGLDEQICELLTIKIKQVSQEYTNMIGELENKMDVLQEVIGKYKSLTPKTFKLMELSMEELFGAMAKIHRDAF